MTARSEATAPHSGEIDLMNDKVTVIRNAAWVVAWDAQASRHVYQRDADVAFSSAGIVHVGPRYEGEAGTEIVGADLMVLPGFVNIHCHSGDEPIAKGLFEDAGTAALWGNALYEYSALFDSDPDAKSACQTVMMSDLMRSGVTTFLESPRRIRAGSPLRCGAVFAPTWLRVSARRDGRWRTATDWITGGRSKMAATATSRPSRSSILCATILPGVSAQS